MPKVAQQKPVFYAIKLIYMSSLSRLLPYRLEKTPANYEKCLAIIAVLDSLFCELKYTHEMVEVTSDPKAL